MPDPAVSAPDQGEILLLATESQVYAFDLSETFRIAMGRHESNDVQLHSRNVSNHHAELLKEADGLYLHDLRSTNGTFLNDEKIRHCRISAGDNIRIGSHLLSVQFKPRKVAWEGASRLYSEDVFAIGAEGTLVSIRDSADQTRKTHPSGNPNDLALVDLLKILSTVDRKTLVVVRAGNEEARIRVEKARIPHAACRRASGEKALYRVFGWEKATYQLQAVSPDAAPAETITLPPDTLLMEGVQQAQDVEKLWKQLPAPETPLRLKEDCPLPLAALSPAEIDVYRHLVRCETIGRVLEESPLPDFKTLSLILSLVSKGVFETVTSSDALFEGTIVSRPKLTGPN